MSRITVILPVSHQPAWKNTLKSILSEGSHDSDVIFVVRNASKGQILTDHPDLTQDMPVISDHEELFSILGKTDSQYVYFADPDTVIDRTVLDTGIARADETGADLLIFGGEEYDPLRNETAAEKLINPGQKESFTEIHPDRSGEYLFQIGRHVLYNRLIRSSLVKDIPVRINDNPLYISSLLLLLSQKTILVHQKLYTYTKPPKTNESVLKSSFFHEKLQALDALYDAVCGHDDLKNIKDSYFNLVSSELKQAIHTYDLYDRRLALYHELNAFLERTGFYNHSVNQYSDLKAVENLRSVPYILKTQELVRRRETIPGYRTVRQADRSGCSEPAVSVIIPFYNEHAYLKECLDSVCAQTLRNIEIICVDDGSDDDSLAIALKAADRDQRIKILKQSNGGLSAARNTGVSEACGKYLYFIDSDDMLEADALKSLSEKADSDDLDVLIFNGKSFCEEDGLEGKINHYRNYYLRTCDYSGVFSGPEIFCRMKENDEYRSSVCMQLIRRSFYADNGLQFPHGILHEDNGFEFKLLLLAQRVGYLPDAFYLRRVHTESIMTSSVTFKNAFGYFYAYLDMKQALEEIPESADRYPFIHEMYNTAALVRKRYRALPFEERMSYLALPDADRMMFEIVAADIERVRSSESQYKKANRKLSKEMTSLRRSASYRIGRALTWIPRKILKIFKKHV